MKAYRQRVAYAVQEFRNFNENKSGWKPSGGRRPTTPKPRQKKNVSRMDDVDAFTTGEADDALMITHQFPLRRGMVVSIKGIPFDVKRSEMSRLTAFLSNLVASQEEVIHPMLNPSPDEVE